MSNIGIMEGAFFVGRKEIVDWINQTLDLNIAKVEDTASGAIACQLLDIMYPGQVPMQKVNWGAKQSFEFVSNYKILQTCFTKLHIDKFVDVDRLIMAKYMDNLEFMQWFKRFFELSVESRGDYDCLAQRQKGKGSESVPNATVRKPSSASKIASASTAKMPKPAPSATAKISQQVVVKPQKENKAPRIPQASEPSTAKSSAHENNGGSNKINTVDSSISLATVTKLETEIANLKQNNEEQARQYSELRVELESVQKERDFYFDKLRDIEVMLQEVEDDGRGNELTASIFKVLYATAEGFEQVVEDVNPAESAPNQVEVNDSPDNDTF